MKMQKIFLMIVGLLATLIFACDSDDSSSTPPDQPTITINRTPPESPYGVGENITFAIQLRADPAVGIASFRISKGGTELFSETTYSSNVVNFNFEYTTVSADLDLEEVTLTFQLTDMMNNVVSIEEKFKVEQEYAYFQEAFRPNPSWDLVENLEVTLEDGENVDVFAEIVTSFGGSTITFFGKNETVFYNVDNSISVLDPNLSTEQIQIAISNLQPVTKLVLSDELSTPTVPNQYPIVAKLRGKDVFVVIGFATSGGGVWGYRKTSEFAGR